MDRLAIVNGKPVGPVWKDRRGHWVWQRGKIAQERYAKGTRLSDVREHIAGLFHVTAAEVKISPQQVCTD
jgi:hypothetical protein